MDAAPQLDATFDLRGFMGYVRLYVDRGQLRPRIEHELSFRGEREATVVVPRDLLPIGLLRWDADKQAFAIETIYPDQEKFR